MRVWLHGPREGQDFQVKNIKFEKGVAEIQAYSSYLERYYNVKDYPPKGWEEEAEPEAAIEAEDVQLNSAEDEAVLEDAQKELNSLMEDMKKDFSVERLKTQKDFNNNWPSFKSYVKKTTGINPRGGKQAHEIMQKYAEENNCIYEVE